MGVNFLYFIFALYCKMKNGSEKLAVNIFEYKDNIFRMPLQKTVEFFCQRKNLAQDQNSQNKDIQKFQKNCLSITHQEVCIYIHSFIIAIQNYSFNFPSSKNKFFVLIINKIEILLNIFTQSNIHPRYSILIPCHAHFLLLSKNSNKFLKFEIFSSLF